MMREGAAGHAHSAAAVRHAHASHGLIGYGQGRGGTVHVCDREGLCTTTGGACLCTNKGGACLCTSQGRVLAGGGCVCWMSACCVWHRAGCVPVGKGRRRGAAPWPGRCGLIGMQESVLWLQYTSGRALLALERVPKTIEGQGSASAPATTALGPAALLAAGERSLAHQNCSLCRRMGMHRCSNSGHHGGTAAAVRLLIQGRGLPTSRQAVAPPGPTRGCQGAPRVLRTWLQPSPLASVVVMIAAQNRECGAAVRGSWGRAGAAWCMAPRRLLERGERGSFLRAVPHPALQSCERTP